MTALSVTSHVLLMTNIPADQPLGGGWETVGRCVNRALHDLEPERSRILVVILTSHLLFILIVAVNMCQLRGVKPLKQCREVILTAVILMITLASNRSTP